MLGRLESFASQGMYRACEDRTRAFLSTIERDLRDEAERGGPRDEELRAILMLLKRGVRAIHEHDVSTFLGVAADVRDAFALRVLRERERMLAGSS